MFSIIEKSNAIITLCRQKICKKKKTEDCQICWYYSFYMRKIALYYALLKTFNLLLLFDIINRCFKYVVKGTGHDLCQKKEIT